MTMPVVSVRVPEGALDPEQKQDLVSRITDAVVEVERAEKVRPYVVVTIDEVADGGWGQGGRALTLETIRALSAET
jgi:4-oxalocrotonate tautomerase